LQRYIDSARKGNDFPNTVKMVSDRHDSELWLKPEVQYLGPDINNIKLYEKTRKLPKHTSNSENPNSII